jgi:hypothetical protein
MLFRSQVQDMLRGGGGTQPSNPDPREGLGHALQIPGRSQGTGQVKGGGRRIRKCPPDRVLERVGGRREELSHLSLKPPGEGMFSGGERNWGKSSYCHDSVRLKGRGRDGALSSTVGPK